jgi:hypothetical protein
LYVAQTNEIAEVFGQLHRHAARYPTNSAGKCMLEAMTKLANRKITEPRRHPELGFLAHADLTMRGWRFEELMDQGRKA